ncbi:dehydrogenase [Thermococcus sp. 21S7]|nr:dehydrogenase [Thermococcus sp. 21S7]
MYVVLALFTLMLLPLAGAEKLVLWEGKICEDVPYQKSIEAVSILDGRIYVGCSYRQVANASGLIGIYYLGRVAAYSMDGSLLWQNDSGYVIGLKPLPDGHVVVGSMGGFITFDEKGRFMAHNVTSNKLYDFQIVGGTVYAVDGDFFIEQGNASYVGHLYRGRLVNDTVVLGDWTVNFTSLTSRVRVGNGVIYVGAGFPSGYTGPGEFGHLYGVSPEGKMLWDLNLGEWVRDMEVLNGNLLAGTGRNPSDGHLYYVSPEGKMLWKRSLFYVEDVEVGDGRVYVGGMGNGTGVLAALDPSDGKVLWTKTFPWRVKVVKYADGKLLVGTGKFESSNANGTSMVYSVGALYILDAKTGKELESVPDTGYVRSVAVEGSTAVIGTASQRFYVIDLNAVKTGGICGPGFVVLLGVLMGGMFSKRRRRSH